MPDNTNGEPLDNKITSQPENSSVDIIAKEVTDITIINYETDNMEVHHHSPVS
jgi:hypothetical protein